MRANGMDGLQLVLVAIGAIAIVTLITLDFFL